MRAECPVVYYGDEGNEFASLHNTNTPQLSAGAVCCGVFLFND
jgi:hypothetical protein